MSSLVFQLLSAFYLLLWTMERPWYYRKAPPLFCDCCLPFYTSVRPAKTIVLVVSLIVWLIGALLILAVLFTCTIVTCRGVAAALVPLGCLLTWIGYALFHCAWGAHLLDEEEIKMKAYRDPEQRAYEQPPAVLPPAQSLELHDGSPFKVNVEEVVIPEHNPRDAGYWKFVGDDAWQNKCSRDTLQ